MGAWSLFGLGTENTSLPGFVTINPPSGLGGAQNYGSAFLPSANQGQRIGIERESRLLRRGGTTSPVANITNLRYGSKTQRRQLDLTRDLNESYARKQRSDADTIGAITESYELAFRMQAELPDLLDLTGVDDRTAARYGIGSEETDGFARQCLYALRMAESGVRFIEVNQGGWDHHFNLREELPASCRAVDRPIAALLEDLERTGLATLEEPLTDADPWPIDQDASHHMGTTRMGIDPASSVTDPDLLVRGTTNLYAAGASSFPTSGCANPTYTIVALSIRLARHLRACLQEEGA